MTTSLKSMELRVAAALGRRTAKVAITDERGESWGWMSDCPPRFGLWPLGPGRRAGVLWLESFEGSPTLEPSGVTIATVADLAPRVAHEWVRLAAQWIRTMLVRGWVRVEVTAAGFELTVYAGTARARVVPVEVSWGAIVGPRAPTSHDIELSDLTLVLGVKEHQAQQRHLRLDSLLWTFATTRDDNGRRPQR